MIALRSSASFLFVRLPFAFVLGGALPARGAVLTFVDSYIDGEQGIEGLAGAASVAVSPDGRHVYVASGRDSAVAMFRRDPRSGRLVFLDALTDGSTAEGIGGAAAVAVAPDGAQVFVAGRSDSAVSVFDRDETTGVLTFLEAHFDGMGDNDGLGGAAAIAVSPEATDVYVASESDSSVAAFRRDPATGAVGFLEAHFDGVGGVEGLERTRGIAVSPDGANLYAVGNRDNAIVTFARDPVSGSLTFLESLVDGVDVARGLKRPNAVVVSDDARQVYVASFDEDLTIFARDEFTGRLAFMRNVNVLPGGPNSLTLSLDGSFLFVTSFISSERSELNVFSRDPGTGSVALVETHANGEAGTSGLAGASGSAASPDGRHVYVTGTANNAIAAFTTDTPCPDDCDRTPTATPLTPTPTASTVPSTCPGDCDRDGTVSVGELVTGVNIGLGNTPLTACPAFEANGDGRLTIDELLAAVGSGLAGCSGE